MFDVIISGAGPSGSHCAKVLAKAGYKVALIERNTKWRKPCGGSVSHEIVKLYPQINKLNPPKINGTFLFSGDYNNIEYRRTDGQFSVVVDRLNFDNLIRNITTDAGVELFDKELSFEFITKEGNPIGIKTKSSGGIKEYFGKIIIIADGMSSKLANNSGIRSKWKIIDLGLTKCAIMEGENNLDIDHLYVYFRKYMGFAWIFPLNESRFNIGCGIFGKDNLKYNLNQIYEEFINDPHLKQYLPTMNYKVIWSSAYPVPAEGVLEKSLFSNNLMLIGDTAGFVSPITAEGIYGSIFSANAAAEVAIKALEKEDCSKNFLEEYSKHPTVKRIIRNFKVNKAARKFFYENEGQNLNEMFKRAKSDLEYREKLLGMFFSKK